MSLINEALKKAQRVRTEEPGDPATASAAAPTAAGGRIAKRGKATSANTMVLIGSGAIVLIVLSVVVTVILVNRPDTPDKPVASAKPAATTPPPAAVETPAPLVVGPNLTPPTPTPSPAPAESGSSPAGTNATPTASTSPAAAGPITPAAVAPTADTPPSTAPSVAAPTPPPVAVAPAPAPPPVPDERITAFVDAIKVAGIRSSGTESRVLMNERVYRVNDLVDRALGIRLIKVGTDTLTFADAKGATYVKNF